MTMVSKRLYGHGISNKDDGGVGVRANDAMTAAMIIPDSGMPRSASAQTSPRLAE